jgi:hypothetical protein
MLRRTKRVAAAVVLTAAVSVGAVLTGASPASATTQDSADLVKEWPSATVCELAEALHNFYDDRRPYYCTDHGEGQTGDPTAPDNRYEWKWR